MTRNLWILLALGVGCGACSSTSHPSTTTATTSTVAASSTSAAPPGSCHSGPTASGGSGDVAVPGDIPDNQAYVPYPSTAGYRIDLPEGWARSIAGDTTIVTDKFSAIRVRVVAAAAMPTVASAQSVDVPALAGSVACFNGPTVTSITRSAGPAILITYHGDSPPDPVTGKVVAQDIERYEFWHAGKEAIITLASPHGSDNVDPWKRVTNSFVWQP